MKKSFLTDIVIVGCGVAGLYTALKLPKERKITIISKGAADECDSYLAQGGICMLRDENDYDSYFEDTMRAGHYENNTKAVDQMIRESVFVIDDLISYGTRFARTADGKLDFTREGAHSNKRILFHEDITGKEITSHLLEEVKTRSNITIYENVTMVDILTCANDNKEFCSGILCLCSPRSPLYEYSNDTSKEGNGLVCIEASATILACGGIGGLFNHSTNYPILTGDALAVCLKHGIKLENPDYIQIHPTTLFTTKNERAFLITESVRGEGGILLNSKKQRFVDELLPRDVVSNAIFAEMKKEGSSHVWLSMENIPKEEILTHFCHIYEKCLEEGYDCTKEPIPVVPAQHYFMGGIKVDLNGQTSLPMLFAIGETCCNGVHGKNRLASNSLLESLVWAKKAAITIEKNFFEYTISLTNPKDVNLEEYKDENSLFSSYRKIVLDEIERMKHYHEQHTTKKYSTPVSNHNETSGRRTDLVSA